jgi:hypothetical protein
MGIRQDTHLCIPKVRSEIITLLAELEGYDFVHFACLSRAGFS